MIFARDLDQIGRVTVTLHRCTGCGSTFEFHTRIVRSHVNPALTTGLALDFDAHRAWAIEHRPHGGTQQVHDEPPQTHRR